MNSGINVYASQRERLTAPGNGVRMGRTSAPSTGGFFH